MENLCLKMVEE